MQEANHAPRKQFYTDPMTKRCLSIDCDQGASFQVDMAGQPTRTYHLGISGCEGVDQRVAFALSKGKQSMVPDVPRMDPDVVPQLLKSMNLEHFLPIKSSQQLFRARTSDRATRDRLFYFQQRRS